MKDEFKKIPVLNVDNDAYSLRRLVSFFVLSTIVSIFSSYLVLIYFDMIFIGDEFIGFRTPNEILITLGALHLGAIALLLFLFARSIPLLRHDEYMTKQLVRVNNIINNREYYKRINYKYNRKIPNNGLEILINVTIAVSSMSIINNLVCTIYEKKGMFMAAYLILMLVDVLNVICQICFKKFLYLKFKQDDALANIYHKLNHMDNKDIVSFDNNNFKICNICKHTSIAYIVINCLILDAAIFLLTISTTQEINYVFILLATLLIFSSGLNIMIGIISQNYFYHQSYFNTSLDDSIEAINSASTIVKRNIMESLSIK